MAGMKEMALGIAATLRSKACPNPLPIQLRGYAPDDGADLLRYIIDECYDANIDISEIKADPILVHALTRSKTKNGLEIRGIIITADPTANGQLDIYQTPGSPHQE